MNIRLFSSAFVTACLVSATQYSWALPTSGESLINPHNQGQTYFPDSLNSPNFTSPQLYAQGRGGGRRQEMMESLNLSSQQEQELQAIRQQYGEKIRPLKKQLRTNEDQLRTLMSSSASDDQIRAKQRQVSSLRQQIGGLLFESMLESRAILNMDQRKQFAEMMGERRRLLK